jgi:hypothetical protein
LSWTPQWVASRGIAARLLLAMHGREAYLSCIYDKLDVAVGGESIGRQCESSRHGSGDALLIARARQVE